MYLVCCVLLLIGLISTNYYHELYYLGVFSLISDVAPHSWLVDVDPHSLISPYHEAASLSVELCDTTASVAENEQCSLSVQGRLRGRYGFWKSELEGV